MRALLFCLLVVVSSCSKKTVSKTTSTATVSADANKLVEPLLGSKYHQSLNASKTLLLAVREKEATEIFSEYIVIDLTSNKVLRSGKFRPGYIQWKEDTLLELLNVPGTLPSGKKLSDYTELIQLSNSH